MQMQLSEQFSTLKECGCVAFIGLLLLAQGIESNPGPNHKEQSYWEQILKEFGKSKCFLELEKQVSAIDIPSEVPVNFNKPLPADHCDFLAKSLIHETGPWKKGESFPIQTKADGNCFFNALSRLCFGNENHSTELRVRTIIEGVKNKAIYLDDNYLQLGYSGEDKKLSKKYQEFSDFPDRSIEEAYENEVLSLCHKGAYSGVWQFFQSANIINTAIMGIFPSSSEPSYQQHFQRLFLPSNGNKEETFQNNKFVSVMWTATNTNSLAFNHFVPVVRY